MRAVWAEAGDTAYTRSKTLLGTLIREGEEHPGDPNAWANHMLVVVESGYLIPPEKYGYGIIRDFYHFNYSPEGYCSPKLAVVVEALWHTERNVWWEKNKKSVLAGKNDIRVFHPIPQYNEEEMKRFISSAESYIGDRYGWWKLGGFLIRKFTGIDVPHIFFIKDRPICSFLAAKVNDDARKRSSSWPGFGMPPQEADPDTAMDFNLQNPEFWGER